MPAVESTPAYYETYWEKNVEWTPDTGVNNPDERMLFDRLLRPGMKLVDYGCGNGQRYGRDMIARGIDYRGFDISQTALEHAARLGLKVDQINQDGSIPVDEATADFAICFEVLEHLMEPDRALAAIHHALKPGATAVVSVPNAAFVPQRIEFLLTGFWNPGGSPLTARRTPWRDAHIRFYNPRILRRMLESAGFEFQCLHSQAFSFSVLPWCYKRIKLHRLLDFLSLPIARLGRVFPGLFSPRLFAVVKKMEQASSSPSVK